MGVAEEAGSSKSPFGAFLPVAFGVCATFLLSWFSGQSAARTEQATLQARFEYSREQNAKDLQLLRSDIASIQANLQKIIGDIGELRGMEGRRP